MRALNLFGAQTPSHPAGGPSFTVRLVKVTSSMLNTMLNVVLGCELVAPTSDRCVFPNLTASPN
jgi:hypothetical protein